MRDDCSKRNKYKKRIDASGRIAYFFRMETSDKKIRDLLLGDRTTLIVTRSFMASMPDSSDWVVTPESIAALNLPDGITNKRLAVTRSLQSLARNRFGWFKNGRRKSPTRLIVSLEQKQLASRVLSQIDSGEFPSDVTQSVESHSEPAASRNAGLSAILLALSTESLCDVLLKLAEKFPNEGALLGHSIVVNEIKTRKT